MPDSLFVPDEVTEPTIRLKRLSIIADENDLDCITVGHSRFSQRDVQLVSQSLSYLNPFLARRATDKQQLVFMREVLATGEITSLEISLRHLLGCVNNVADSIDARDLDGKDMKSFGIHSAESSLKFSTSRNSVNSTDIHSATINLRVRDLRRLDFHFNPKEEPSIWVRRYG